MTPPMTDEDPREDAQKESDEEDPLDPETRRIFEASMERNKDLLERLAEM